jgi:iron(III) transport system ATP-binding protein
LTDLVVRQLQKSFGGPPVLSGLDLAVPEGALAAIVGPSGSGKTTLLRIVAGFERADEGSVAFGGLEVDGARFVPPEERGVGYVPQEGALFPHLNVVRNVGFGLPRAERSVRAAEVIELVGLGGLERRYPHELSGGQQQRVALARALAVRPRLVLLDEPFSSLDAGLRASVRGDVKAVLRAAHTTAVLVTHDQDEALSFADLVGVLRDGRIVQLDAPARLYQRPVDPGIAAFVGQANFLPAVMEDDRARCAMGTLAVVDPPQAGAKVTLLLRPEHVSLEDASGGDAGLAGTVPGVVLDLEYFGHDAIVRVALGTGQAGPVEEAVEVVARVAGREPPPPAAQVRLRVTSPCRVWVD